MIDTWFSIIVEYSGFLLNKFRSPMHNSRALPCPYFSLLFNWKISQETFTSALNVYVVTDLLVVEVRLASEVEVG